ncbi:transposase domain-containing protein [Neokomagataea anthophila]|uniref:Mu transposase C-terminal domain-containing protein n=1 Tax=Neokomagataea anthophila TaxID=2826925 RepID=A0ABS5E6J1_9PROT|nr:transposase domain-containing protein [Neokomagataea anthophila]MBR0559527.1 Mu transposase C-terminal domain-containing protein [Neokomagataea anthophila]
MMHEQKWFSPAELAAMNLPGMPATARAIQLRVEHDQWMLPEQEGQTWRKRQGRGGGFEFTPYHLPFQARVALELHVQRTDDPALAAEASDQREREDLWRKYDALPDTLKERARKALRALHAVEGLVASGTRKTTALTIVAHEQKVGRNTINNWYRDVRGLNRCDWLAGLAPHYGARAGDVAECPSEAWNILAADYLRLERPGFEACYRRLQQVAEQRGWTLPSSKSLFRRMKKYPAELLVAAREGEEKLKQMYPAQKRDHTVFDALEAVNADGHKWDVFVKWPVGAEERIVRPVMIGFQDIFSGKILSWRIDLSENKEAVRLAFGDLVERYGIPKYCYFDNGRNFSSKWLTGGVPNRYRFKVRDEEPLGILPQLGVDVRFVKPYSGRSKPIERAWRDFAQDLAKHPRFAGAYTGHKVDAKPENYGSTAVPLDVFIEVVAQGIAEHNARIGRRSDVCQGKYSFDQVFEASYARAPITKATDEQRRLWLMPAESVTISKRDGVIEIEGNRFWADFLNQYPGEKVVVRLDPENLQQDVHVYRMDGTYLGAAACREKVGFADKAAAQRHARAYKAYSNAAKAQREAAVRLSQDELARVFADLPTHDETPLEAKIVRPLRPRPLVSGANALAVDFDNDEECEREAEEMAEVMQLRNYF